MRIFADILTLGHQFQKTLIMEPAVNNFESTKPSLLSVKDCLKLIGIKELTANIYAVPKANKSKKEMLPA